MAPVPGRRTFGRGLRSRTVGPGTVGEEYLLLAARSLGSSPLVWPGRLSFLPSVEVRRVGGSGVNARYTLHVSRYTFPVTRYTLRLFLATACVSHEQETDTRVSAASDTPPVKIPGLRGAFESGESLAVVL